MKLVVPRVLGDEGAISTREGCLFYAPDVAALVRPGHEILLATYRANCQWEDAETRVIRQRPAPDVFRIYPMEVSLPTLHADPASEPSQRSR